MENYGIAHKVTSRVGFIFQTGGLPPSFVYSLCCRFTVLQNEKFGGLCYKNFTEGVIGIHLFNYLSRGKKKKTPSSGPCGGCRVAAKTGKVLRPQRQNTCWLCWTGDALLL